MSGAFEVTAADEGRHPPGTEELWGESWYHDFAASDGSYGGYVRLGLYPNLGVVWYWVHLVRRDRPLVLVRDHATPLPSGDALDLRTDRFAASWRCTEPLRRWRITTDGTGIELANPADAFHGEQGPDVAVRVDLEWEGVAPCFPYSMTTRFEQSATVRGEIEIGGETIVVDCPGQRDHSWGVRDWWAFPWIWSSGRLDDGTWWHAVRSMIPDVDVFQTGYVVDPDGQQREVTTIRADVELDAEKLPTRAALAIGELELEMTAELHAPVLLVADDGRESRFPRAVCRFVTPDGREGRGWTELNWPPGSPPGT